MNYFAMPSVKEAATPEMIIQEVCRVYKVQKEKVTSHCRKRELVFPRHLAMYTIHRKTKIGPTATGRIFDTDHSTVISAIRSIENYLETDSLGKRHEILEFIHSV